MSNLETNTPLVTPLPMQEQVDFVHHLFANRVGKVLDTSPQEGGMTYLSPQELLRDLNSKLGTQPH